MSDTLEDQTGDSKADATAAAVVFLCLVLIAVQFISGGRLLSLLGLD